MPEVDLIELRIYIMSTYGFKALLSIDRKMMTDEQKHQLYSALRKLISDVVKKTDLPPQLFHFDEWDSDAYCEIMSLYAERLSKDMKIIKRVFSGNEWDGGIRRHFTLFFIDLLRERSPEISNIRRRILGILDEFVKKGVLEKGIVSGPEGKERESFWLHGKGRYLQVATLQDLLELKKFLPTWRRIISKAENKNAPRTIASDELQAQIKAMFNTAAAVIPGSILVTALVEILDIPRYKSPVSIDGDVDAIQAKETGMSIDAVEGRVFVAELLSDPSTKQILMLRADDIPDEEAAEKMGMSVACYRKKLLEIKKMLE